MQEKFRWVIVLPGAIIGSILGRALLHLVLYFTLAKGETVSGVNIYPIEHFLSPFVVAVGYTITAYELAPKNKAKTVSVLACLYVLVMLVYPLFADAHYEARAIGALIGLAVGIWFSKAMSKDESKPQLKLT